MTQNELLAKRREILKIAAQYGARDVRVFGSAARDDAGPDSDVDFLVTLEPDRSLLDHAGLILALEALLGCEVDVVVEQGLRPRMREHVLAEAIAL